MLARRSVVRLGCVLRRRSHCNRASTPGNRRAAAQVASDAPPNDVCNSASSTCMQNLQDSEWSYIQAKASEAPQITCLHLARQCESWTGSACPTCCRADAQTRVEEALKQALKSSRERLTELQNERGRGAALYSGYLKKATNRIKHLNDTVTQAEACEYQRRLRCFMH